MFLLSVALAITQATSTTTIDQSLPSWLERFSSTYQDCLFRVIDRQYDSGRFSEKRALSECAASRRVQVKEAEVARTKIGSPRTAPEVIIREFARLDDSVWTIVGHLRARHHRKQ